MHAFDCNLIETLAVTGTSQSDGQSLARTGSCLSCIIPFNIDERWRSEFFFGLCGLSCDKQNHFCLFLLGFVDIFGLLQCVTHLYRQGIKRNVEKAFTSRASV